ncbi:LuxR family transcriptional regulator [Streptomyces sp. MK5]|uniref:helix-turn-helix transcriptional regulator n=1 Tax=Streptomyces sp. MK5 TaxID=3064253 RepID=UPI002741EBB6|nr:LuxR family transcriptional regulator [Streptomyces sp. MK5]
MPFMWGHEVAGTVDEVLAGAAPEGSCRTLLVEGPSGCGRSTLVDAVIERATAVGAVVLSAVGWAGERTVPGGVLRQLAHRVPQLLPAGDVGPVPAATRVEDMQRFCRAVDSLGSDAPVVICVDDAHHADRTSLDHLQYLARHGGRARVLLVVTVPLQERPSRAAFLTELLRRPGFRRVTLGPLSRETAADVVRSAGHGRLAGPLYELSGGNPLLLRALLEECPRADRAEPRPGGPYAMAVAACLHRSGPGTAAVAQVCALLGPRAGAERAARVLGLPTEEVRRTLSALEAAALLTGGRTRHPVAQDVILAAVPAGRRAELHRRAARVLRAEGCPAAETAGHLLAAAEHAPGADAEHLRTLCDTAEDLLAEDDAAGALRLLELAHRCCPEGPQRTAVGLRLAQVSWRLDPAAAEPHLDSLLRAGRLGRLDPAQAQPLAQLLMAQGRCADLAEAADDSGRRADPAGAPALPPLGAATGDTVPAGEHLLQSARLTDATLLPVWQALFSLTYSAGPQRAVPWTRRLLAEAERRRAPGWHAAFAELHAQALLRTGDLTGAVEFAERALAALSGSGRAPFAYSARAVLVRAHDALGRYDRAAEHLDAPPPALLRTRHGLAFLHARGHHHLTSGQPQPALADFLEVGRLMREWRIDHPAYLPWRTDAAEALLRLGHVEHAAHLAGEQLALPDARHPWTDGQALRVQALATTVPQRRAALLTRALVLLRQSGDRLATARTLADLARLHAPGTPARTAHLEAAWRLSEECGAAALAHDILPVAPAQVVREAENARPRPASGETRLTASEQRVATLAAQGLTNREISARLCLTVSTVEQHLTRVYRKLHITSRRDLPLQMTPLTPAASGTV